MNFTRKSLWTPLLLTATSVQALTPIVTPEVGVEWRYQEADTSTWQKGRGVVRYDDLAAESFSSDPQIEKTILVLDIAKAIKSSLAAYDKACNVVVDDLPIRLERSNSKRRILPRPPFPPILPPHPLPDAECPAAAKTVGQDLLKSVSLFDARLSSQMISDEDLIRLGDLTRKLGGMMADGKPQFTAIRREVMTLGIGGSEVKALAARSLNVTAGGAQGIDFFRKTVEDGKQVPNADALKMEGLLSEFNLALSEQSCDQLLCVNPAIKVDQKAGKLYVQIGMSSNVDAETFTRKPLNLAVVLDISGSMQGTDNTEKSRLEWAKDALIKTIGELGEEDLLSIVLFDTKSEILLPPTAVADRESLIAKVRELKTRGSTNLEAGLRDGYDLVSQNVDGDYESRIVLISDAGLNTGVTSEASLLKLVTDGAAEGIGLTAMGVGLNFNQEFIHNITQSEGGNYVFVNSGLAMFKYFQAFDYLVTPVAFNFRASLDLYGFTSAKFVSAYGIPTKEGEPVHELVNVKTLFFSEAGGAIILEYDL